MDAQTLVAHFEKLFQENPKNKYKRVVMAQYNTEAASMDGEEQASLVEEHDDRIEIG